MSKSYIQTLTNFHNNFKQEVLPFLQKEEIIRKEILKKLIQHRLTIIGCFIILIALVQIFTELTSPNDISMLIFNQGMISGFIILTCMTMTNIFKYNREKDFQKYLKRKYLSKILKCWKNIEYKKDIICTKQILKKCDTLFNKEKDYDIDDRLCGVYKDVHFEILDRIYLNEDQLNFLKDFNSPKKKVFNGCIICFTLNKNTTTKTTITSKNSLNRYIALLILMNVIIFIWLIQDIINNADNISSILLYIFGFIFLIYSSTIIYKKYNIQKNSKLHLEDINFNKIFMTNSSDQVEGRYAVTPAFMERLLNLKLAFNAKNISASFYEDKLMIAIETNKDLFEIGDLWHPLTDIKYANDFYNEIHSILHMIEYFKLDEKTGL